MAESTVDDEPPADSSMPSSPEQSYPDIIAAFTSDQYNESPHEASEDVPNLTPIRDRRVDQNLAGIQANEDLQECSRDLSQAESRIELLKTLVNKQWNIIGSMADRHKAELGRKDGEIRRHKAETEQMQVDGESAIRDGEIMAEQYRKQKEQLNEQEEELRQMSEELREKEQEFSKKNEHIRGKNRQIRQKDRKLFIQVNKIYDLEAGSAAKDERIRRLEGQATVKD
jgi:chromosome segregation ATPase